MAKIGSALSVKEGIKEMKMNMNRRKHYFIDKRFQLKFILAFLSILALLLVGGNSILYYSLEKKLAEAMYSSHLAFKTVGEIILPIILQVNITTLLLGVFLIGIVTYLYFRKIYKRLKSLVVNARRVSQGDLTVELAYPPDKRLTRFFESFNEAIRSWQIKILRLKIGLQDLTITVQELKQSGEGNESLPNDTQDEKWQEARKRFSASIEAYAKIFSGLKF